MVSGLHQNIKQYISPLFLHVVAFVILAARSLLIRNYNLVLILVLVCSLQNLCLSFTYNARLLTFCLSVRL